MELVILLVGSVAIFLCPVQGYVKTCPGPGDHYITEEVRSAECDTSAYQSLYYKENWGQGQYYTDENQAIKNIYGRNAVMLGKIRSIYEQNVTKTYTNYCTLTQKKFILEIGLTCVLRNVSGNHPFPNPIVLRHDCPFRGIDVSDDVIFSPGTVSHKCRRINKGPCLDDESDRWGFGQITLFKQGPSVMEKLVRVCGLNPQRPSKMVPHNCPRITVTKDTCDSGTLLTPFAAVYMFMWCLLTYTM